MMKKTEKEKFGFASFGHIWGLKGNTYEVKDELKAMGFHFSKTFLWTIASEEEPKNLPKGLTPFKIEWSKISYISPTDGKEHFCSDAEIKAYLDTLRYDTDETSAFVEGEIGVRYDFDVKVISVREINSAYGTSFLHEFETTDGKTLTWFTQSLKQGFEEDEEAHIRGTIKEFKTFRGKKQTVLSRVMRAKNQPVLPNSEFKGLKQGLIGTKVNHLLILEPVRLKTGRVGYKCQCDCGNIVEVRTDHLTNGRNLSCGKCLTDLTGKKFNHLTVLGDSGKRCHGRIVWKCRCDCGNIIEVETSHLTQNHTQSCGCLKSAGEQKIQSILTENNIPYEKEKMFETCRNPKTNNKLRFDFFVNNDYLIEFDGKQHFMTEEMGFFTKEELDNIKYRDEIKNQWCKDNNIRLIRIPYTKLDTLTLEDLI